MLSGTTPRGFAEDPQYPGHLQQAKVPQLSSNFRIIVYIQPSGATSPMVVAGGFQLLHFVYVRNVGEITGANRYQARVNAWFWDPSASGLPIGSSPESSLHKYTSFLIKPVPGHPDMVLATPAETLSPGLYELASNFSETRFFIGQPADAEAQNCLDLSYVNTAQQFKFIPTACGNSANSIAPNTSETSLAAAGQPVPPTALPPQPSQPATPKSTTSEQPVATTAAAAAPSAPLAEGPVRQDGPSEWNKAITLGKPVTFTVCHLKTLANCESGTFSLSPKEISFTPTNGQKLFAVPSSQVTTVNARNSPMLKNASVELKIGGKNYTFDPFPAGITCRADVYLSCPQEGIDQQLVVANYIAQTIPKLTSGTLGPSPTQPAVTSPPPPSTSGSQGNANGAIVEQLKNLIASSEGGRFSSPLNNEQLLQLVIQEAQRAGVPVWLLFGQAKFETTFGDPINATTRDGVTFTDGSSGNAHNLFNIRPGIGWSGKVLNTGRGGQFRAYDSYEAGISDYLRLISSDLYRGKTLDQLINTYFPAGENGSTRVAEYISGIVKFAHELGFPVDNATVPVR